MTTAKTVTNHKRGNFKRIMAQLDKTKAESKIIKIMALAQAFLDEHDIGWDTINIYIPANYVPPSERARLKKARTTSNGVDHTPRAILGGTGRDLLKRALVRHPDWETVRVTLDLDIASMKVNDLLATADLLGVDPQFTKLFEKLPEEQPVTPPSNTQEKK